MNQGRRSDQVEFSSKAVFFAFIGCAVSILILILGYG